MSNIRVTYSGLIAFIVGIGGILLGLVFTLMITRRLSPEEFGVWSLVLSIINYFLLAGPIVSYWTTRQIARGEKVGKTSVFTNLIISLFAIPIFVAYVFFISEASTIRFETLLFGLILLPTNFVAQSLDAINIGHKPESVSYTKIIFESFKIPFVLGLVVFFNLGVEGAIFALFLALLGKIIFQSYYAKENLKVGIYLTTIKRWFKQSWIPSFAQIPNYLQMIDIVLYSVITGSVIGIAFYQAAFTLGLLVASAGAITQGLYPKILAEKNFDGINKNIVHLLYFVIPLFGITILFSKPGLYALNPEYVGAWLIVIILSAKISLKVLWSIPSHTLLGLEQIDTQSKSTFSNLLRSNLFRIPAFGSIFYGAYITLLVILFFTTDGIIDELDVVLWWAILGLLAEFSFTLFLWTYAKKQVKISIPYKNVLKYVIATLVFAGIFLLTSDHIIIYEPSIYVFLPRVILQLTICISAYLAVTYFIDRDARDLFKSIIKEIRKF